MPALMTKENGSLLNLEETAQLNLALKAKTRRRWTKEEKRKHRQLHAEGKSRQAIAAEMGISEKRVREGERYHINKVRYCKALKRATNTELEQELIRRSDSSRSMPVKLVAFIVLAALGFTGLGLLISKLLS